MNDARNQAVLSAVRTLLAAAGGWMATHDYIDADTMNEIVGAIMILIPLAWGIWSKYRAERDTKAREAVAVNVGIAVADRTAGVTPAVPAADTQAVIKAFTPVAPVAADEQASMSATPDTPLMELMEPTKRKAK